MSKASQRKLAARQVRALESHQRQQRQAERERMRTKMAVLGINDYPPDMMLKVNLTPAVGICGGGAVTSGGEVINVRVISQPVKESIP